MRFLWTGSTDPYYNLACEEYYLRNSEDDVFMLWQNAPTVVIGRNQNLYAEVALDYTEANGIRVARRITGGGAVYHDLGNVNYTFITSREKAKVLDFQYFTAPVLKGIRSLGIDAVLNGRNDLVAKISEETPGEGEAGRIEGKRGTFAKFSGNAMTATDARILSHGTLLFDSDLSVLSKALKPDEEKLRKKAIRSVRSRVTNLKPLLLGTAHEAMDVRGFLDYLSRFIEEEFQAAPEEADRLPVLSTGLYDRNRSEEYNAGRRKAYQHERKQSFPGGLVVALWDVSDGRISSVKIEGDFFGELDVSGLEDALSGAEATEEGVRSRLMTTDLSRYVSGASPEDFAALFTDAEM